MNRRDFLFASGSLAFLPGMISAMNKDGETDSYNAISVMMNALAYHYTGSKVYRDEITKLMQRETWTRTMRTGSTGCSIPMASSLFLKSAIMADA